VSFLSDGLAVERYRTSAKRRADPATVEPTYTTGRQWWLKTQQ
jgi:hypothetical protein